MTNQKVCCESGNIDECGVCDGNGSSCGKTTTCPIVSSTLNLTIWSSWASQIPRRRLLAWQDDGSTYFRALAASSLAYPKDALNVTVTGEPSVATVSAHLCKLLLGV